jgi:hypothetical protein
MLAYSSFPRQQVTIYTNNRALKNPIGLFKQTCSKELHLQTLQQLNFTRRMWQYAAENIVCAQAGPPLSRMAGWKRVCNQTWNALRNACGTVLTDGVRCGLYYRRRNEGANSTSPVNVVAAMPGTDYRGVIGETRFDSAGDLVHRFISLYDFKGGNKSLISMNEM